VGSIDLLTTIGTLKSPGDLDLVISQILVVHDTPFSTNHVDDSISDLAVIKSVGTLLGDNAKSPRKVGSQNCVAFLEKNTIWCEYMRPIRVVEKK
jgi:hypothetical protein